MRSLRILLCLFLPAHVFAQQLAQDRIVIAHGGAATYGAPLRAAGELGLWKKYRLNAVLVSIPDADKRVAALLDGSVQLYHGGALAPVAAFLRGAGGGADLALVAGAFNRFPWSIVTQHAIRSPADLAGKKIGIAAPGGATELAVRLALKEWSVPAETVTLVPIQGGVNRLIGLSTRALDAAVLAPPDTFTAGKSNFPVLANLGELNPAVPLDVIAARRPFLEKNRAAVKRALEAFAEAVHVLKTDGKKAAGVYLKIMGGEEEPIVAAGLYHYYAPHFSYPPRVGRAGLALAAEWAAGRAGGARPASEVGRMIDESALDELGREGFFKRLR